MRRMAVHAAACLHRRMLISERSGCIDMAFRTDGILVCGSAELEILECAMGIMAVVAMNQSFVDLVMERLVERDALSLVTGVAERGRIRLQQIGLALGVMYAVAVQTTDAGLRVFGALKICVLIGMALQASLVGLTCG